MIDVTSPDANPSVKKFSRRDLLMFAGLGVVGLTVSPQLLDAGLNISLSISSKGLELQVPKEFENVQIPKSNESYRQPDEIILESINLYEFRGQKLGLPKVYLKRGNEYLDFISLAKKFPRLFENKKDEDSTGFDIRLYGMIMRRDEAETVNNADVPDIQGFSAFSQNGIVDYVLHNPGSKIITQAQDYICRKYGWNRAQLISSITHYNKSLPQVKPDDWEEATKIASARLQEALKFLEEKRDIKDGPISISEAIAYFLFENKGDLKESMWDTTLLLKVLARNDINTLLLNDSFDKAESLARLFKDEFSPRISNNWLIEQFLKGDIPKDSPLYHSGAIQNETGKSFMPINKVGTYYHVMNILTWSAVCMDPWVVKLLVSVYYNEQNFGGMDHRIEHGADKVQADLNAAKLSDIVKKMIEKRV